MERLNLSYFAACNSENGFVNFFPKVFDDNLDKKYIIKGGPGTGKSHFMKKVAQQAASNGYSVERIYCSSDPLSLDGIICRKSDGSYSFAMVDGTAPHVMEMDLPGARDEMIQLGEFWRSEQLISEREQIQRISLERKKAYGRLYHWLKALGECKTIQGEILSGCLREEKMTAFAKRLVAKRSEEERGEEKAIFTDGIGMEGFTHISMLEDNASLIYCIRDCGGIAYRLTKAIYEQAKLVGKDMIVAYDPLQPEKITGIFFKNAKILYLVRGEKTDLSEYGVDAHVISMKRFLHADCYRQMHADVRAVQKCASLLEERILEQLDRIKALHFSLEAIYSAAMRFDDMNSFEEKLCREIVL